MKLKKVLIMLLLLINAKPVFSYGASASEFIKYNGMTFRFRSCCPDKLIFTGYTGNDENLVVPESVDGYIVTAIGDMVFKDNQNIKNVTLPDTINYFAHEVFSNSSVVSVNIPKSLRVIPINSFNNCSELETVVFHDDIWAISDTAFSETDIEIPPELYDMVTAQYISTSDSAVYYSNDEWDYRIISGHDDVRLIIDGYIGKDTEIMIPDSIDGIDVTGINIYFELSPSVKSISFPENMKNFDIRLHNTELEEITLPSIERIPDYAFKDCTSLRKINFQGNPETFTIGDHAFENCTDIDFIPYPESCKNINIRNSAFKNTGIQEVIIDIDSSISKEAFRDCNNLSYVELNNTYVNSRAFMSCSALEDVTITGDSVLEEMGFYDCEHLKNISLSDLDISMVNSVYNCPEFMAINNRNAFDAETGDFNKDLNEFIFNNFNGVDDVGFVNLYIQAQANKITDEIISDNMSDIEKIKVIHDWVCNNTVYDYTDEQIYNRKNHNDASVLMNDSTVCEGYAKIVNILYNAAGIESYYISGVGHAWNIVKAGNDYFHIDATWDDGEEISYDWFMKSDDEMKNSGGNHAKWQLSVPSSMHSFQKDILPVCEYSSGDLNKDRSVNIADMVLLSRCVLGEDAGCDNYVLADLTFDGLVDSFDLVKM